ncbi:MAG: radical SAM protein [bacterium]|nr:radical SAM protein [bacterium]
MKVLFTHSYFLHFDKKQLKTGAPYPPLAPLYAAALLRENGFEVKLADLQLSVSPAGIETHLLDFKPDVLVIYDDSFNYLTKMCLTNMREACFEMQKIAKSLGIPVVVSSSDATDHLEKYISKGADYIIIGEAEHTLLELLNSANQSRGICGEGVKGLAYVYEGKILKTLPREVKRELDELPSPAWDLVDIESYRKVWMKSHGYFSINLVTTRGCPYKCNWCAKPVYGNRYNSHSPQRIVHEIKELQRKFQFTHIWFADDIFGLKPNWLREFSECMAVEKIEIRYKIQSRADLLLEDENIRFLEESGCEEVWLGAESGSQKILDAMEKGIKIDQIERATLLLKQHHISPCFFLQFGYPGELAEDIQMTIRMLDKLQPHDIGISVSYPLPGTKFYEQVKSQLHEKQNWTDSNDLHHLFEGPFMPQFYRDLQRFVHYRFRSGQLLEAFKRRNFKRRLALAPYYYIKQQILKRKLNKKSPELLLDVIPSRRPKS